MGLNATLGPNGWEVDPIDDGIVRAKKDLTGGSDFFVAGKNAGFTHTVKQFGAIGDGVADDTAALAAAFLWLKTVSESGSPACLVFPAGTYKTTAAFALPDASGWVVEPDGLVNIIQQTDNTTIFNLLVSSYHSRFQIGGHNGTFNLRWANSQPSTNTNAIGIALGSSQDVADGVFDFKITGVTANYGFRLISIHPTTVAGGYKFPIWGFRFDDITSFQAMTGATICVYSPNTNVGAPRAELGNIYVQGTNCTEERIRIEGIDQLYMRNIEINLGSGKQAKIANCRQVIIDNLRLEQASTSVNYEKAFEFSGSNQQTVIRNFEVQSHALNVANEAALIDCDAGALSVENIECLTITTTQGNLYILGSSNGGAVVYDGDAVFIAENNTYLHSIASAPYIMPRRIAQEMFVKTAVNANLSYVPIPYNSLSDAYFIAAPCYLVGFVVYLASNVTAGTIQIIAYKDGSAIGSGQYGLTITSGSGNGARYHPAFKAFISGAGQAHKFGKGNQLSFNVVTSADFAPTSNTVRVMPILAFVPR